MVKKFFTQLEKLVYWWQKKHLGKNIKKEFINPCFAFLHREDKSRQILSLYQIRLSKLLGKKIVLVTGCFDILHQEHLNFLRKAKKEGDILVVGLESDKRIKKMKGEKRPVNPFSIRAKNIVRLNEVDFVLKLPDEFGSQKTRSAFLRLIKPDILAISSQDPLEKRKRKECQKIGCRLKIVHRYNPSISTTKLLLDKA